MNLEEINQKLISLATQRNEVKKEIEELGNEIIQKENELLGFDNEEKNVNEEIVKLNSEIDNVKQKEAELGQQKAELEQKRAEIFVNTTIEEVKKRLEDREKFINDKVDSIIQEARQTYVPNRKTDYSEDYINELKQKAKDSDPIYQSNMELINRNNAIDNEVSKLIDEENVCEQEIAKIQTSINESNSKLAEIDNKRKAVHENINQIKENQKSKEQNVETINKGISDFIGRRVAATKIKDNQKEIEGLKKMLYSAEQQFNEVNRQYINQFRNKDSFGMGVDSVVVPDSQITVSANDYKGLEARIEKIKSIINSYEEQNKWLQEITDNGATAVVKTSEQRQLWKKILIDYNIKLKQPTTAKTTTPQPNTQNEDEKAKAKEEFIKRAQEAKQKAEQTAKMTREDAEYKAKRDSMIQARLKEQGIDLAGKSFNDLTVEEKQTFKRIRDEVLAELAKEMDIDIDDLKSNTQETKNDNNVKTDNVENENETDNEQDVNNEYNVHMDIKVADGRVRFIKGIENQESRGEFYCIYNTATLQNIILTECIRNNERILEVEELRALLTGEDEIDKEDIPKNITELYEGTENLDLNIIASIMQFDKSQGADKTSKELNAIIKKDISEYVKTVLADKENPNISLAYDMRNKNGFINQLNQGKAANGYEEYEKLKEIAKSSKNYATVELRRTDKIKEKFAKVGEFFKNIFKKKDVKMITPGDEEKEVEVEEKVTPEQKNEKVNEQEKNEKTNVTEEEKKALKEEVIDAMKNDVKAEHNAKGGYSTANYNENINEYLDKNVKNSNNYDRKAGINPNSKKDLDDSEDKEQEQR